MEKNKNNISQNVSGIGEMIILYLNRYKIMKLISHREKNPSFNRPILERFATF
jgi:hypothetical protein